MLGFLAATFGCGKGKDSSDAQPKLVNPPTEAFKPMPGQPVGQGK